jgi:tetratricopeptide (TPR) repeat protein
LAICLGLLASTDQRLALSDTLGGETRRLASGARTWVGAGLLGASLLTLGVSVQAMRAETRIMRSIYALNEAQRHKTSDPITSERWHTQGVALLQSGLAINSDYRKLVSIPSEQLASLGDWPMTAVVLENIAHSRPHIANVWSNLVRAHAELGQAEPALAAWQELQRLQPNTPRTRAMELVALSRTGHEDEAIEKLVAYLDGGVVEPDLLLLAYSLGQRKRQWALVERGLTLRAETWPETAADSYFRLGKVLAEAGKGFEDRALAAFQRGLQAVPQDELSNYRGQVPLPYREQL